MFLYIQVEEVKNKDSLSIDMFHYNRKVWVTHLTRHTSILCSDDIIAMNIINMIHVTKRWGFQWRFACMVAFLTNYHGPVVLN